MFKYSQLKIVSLRDNVEEYGIVRNITHDLIIRHIRFACWLDKVMKTQSMSTYWFSMSTLVTKRY
jgi:hypothetical protein